MGLIMPKGYGWLGSPRKYAYNKVYKRTTFDVFAYDKPNRVKEECGAIITYSDGRTERLNL